MEDESGDQFVAYFLPSDETLEKRSNESKGKEPAEDEEWVNIPIFILQHCIATRGYFKKFTGNWNCLYKMRLYIISVESIGIVSTIHNFWNFSSRYEYKLAREYNWNVKNKAIKGFEVSYLTT